MRKKLRGIKRHSLLDLDLYRVAVPVAGVANANLSVVDIHPEGAEETILFVHGYAGCAETWEHQITHFALHREYRVIVPDLRGHGQSDAPFTQYTMNELVGDLHRIYQELELPEKFTLVGHSFGGSICVEYADKHPDTLEKLVLIATGGEYPLPRAVSLLSRVPVAFLRPLWPYRPRWNAEVHVMKRMMLNNLRLWNGWSKMRSIRTPTLIITGERDTYFPRHVFEEVGKVIPGAEVVDIGSAKHKVQLERHNAVNRAIERFVAGNQKAGSWREQGIPPGLFANRPWLSSYPKDTPYTVPIPQRPLHEFLESAAQWVPKRKATIFYGSSMTYKELNKQVNQFGHSLLGLGIAPGDRVMLAMPNIPQFIIAYYGTLKIGGVVVLPNPDADATQIVEQAKETEAKAMVTLSSFGGLAKRVRREGDVPHIIFADIRQSVTGSSYKKLMERWGEAGISRDDEEQEQTTGFTMTTLIKDADSTPPPIKVEPDDLACIVYTSGTTDNPKGVCLTHENLVANTIQTRHWIPALEYGKEVFLSVLPLMHSYGMTGAMNIPITMGATIVLLPVFELQQVLETIRRYHPTIFPGVPSMYMAINHAPNVRSYGVGTIRACISGAAPLPVEVQEAFEKLSRGKLVEGYGLTEASPVTHANPLFGVRKVGSIGIPIPNTDAKIVDLITGEDLEPGQIGELVVRGPQVMQGYWQPSTSDNTESSLKDGWLYTGDVAIMDNDGYFTIISRKRDTIMAGDYSVYPRDVEEVLYENSKVLEVAVVGVGTTDDNQQKVKAFVVPRPGSELSEEELLDLCRRRLESYAVPWEIEFRNTLPKSFVGKILRRLLIEEQNRNGQVDETLPD